MKGKTKLKLSGKDVKCWKLSSVDSIIWNYFTVVVVRTISSKVKLSKGFESYLQ